MAIDNAPIGSTVWVIADGYIPPGSTGTDPALTSHDSICMLNAGVKDADLEIQVFYTNREPVGPYRITIPAQRAHHQQINDIQGPERVEAGTDYCLIVRSNEPIVVQHTRLDSRQEALALMSTIAYPAR